MSPMKAYLDIETSFSGKISVIGIYHENGTLIQLVGDEVTGQNLITSLTRLLPSLPTMGAALIYR